jgi:hypothetical protein
LADRDRGRCRPGELGICGHRSHPSHRHRCHEHNDDAVSGAMAGEEQYCFHEPNHETARCERRPGVDSHERIRNKKTLLVQKSPSILCFGHPKSIGLAGISNRSTNTNSGPGMKSSDRDFLRFLPTYEGALAVFLHHSFIKPQLLEPRYWHRLPILVELKRTNCRRRALQKLTRLQGSIYAKERKVFTRNRLLEPIQTSWLGSSPRSVKKCTGYLLQASAFLGCGFCDPCPLSPVHG